MAGVWHQAYWVGGGNVFLVTFHFFDHIMSSFPGISRILGTRIVMQVVLFPLRPPNPWKWRSRCRLLLGEMRADGGRKCLGRGSGDGPSRQGGWILGGMCIFLGGVLTPKHCWGSRCDLFRYTFWVSK